MSGVKCYDVKKVWSVTFYEFWYYFFITYILYHYIQNFTMQTTTKIFFLLHKIFTKKVCTKSRFHGTILYVFQEIDSYPKLN